MKAPKRRIIECPKPDKQVAEIVGEAFIVIDPRRRRPLHRSAAAENAHSECYVAASDLHAKCGKRRVHVHHRKLILPLVRGEFW